MKKIVTIMLITLASVTTLSAKTKDPYHFILEGEHLNDKNISYSLFQEKNGELVLIEKSKSHKYYLLELNVGETYVIAFKNKKGTEKILIIEASKSGNFMVDVDWNVPTNAKITADKDEYKITPFLSKKELENIAQN